MPRYYLHLNKRANGVIADDEGLVLGNLDAAREEAFATAREMIADAIEAGRELDVDAIIIADEHGQALDRVLLKAVVPPTLQ